MASAGIYKVSRPATDHVDYDEYREFIVVCRDTYVARHTHPASTPDNEYPRRWSKKHDAWVDGYNEPDAYHGWTEDIFNLVIERIGDAYPDQKLGVICSSFRAG